MTEKELRDKVVSTAISYLGYKESDGTHKKIIDLYNKNTPSGYYRMSYSDPWCATYVSAVAVASGVKDILPMECSCERQINLFKGLNSWVENDAHVPSAGDVIFYDWDDSGSGDNTGWSDHVGIVVSVNGNSMKIIEGNMNNSVGYRTLAVNARYIRGYGVPKYSKKATGGTTTATTTTTTTAKKSVTEIAKEVLAGKWGNGNDRKTALTKAGYNYDSVQAKVNELVKGTPKSSKTVTELAKEVIAGKWGNGEDRKKKLTAAGYDYNAVQKKVNELL